MSERHQKDYYDLSDSETHDEPVAQVEPTPVCAYCLGNAEGPAALTDFFGQHVLSFCGQECEDAWVSRASNYYQTKHENEKRNKRIL